MQTLLIAFMDIPRIHNDQKARYSHFVAQKILVERHFPCFKCDLHLGNLVCRGTITPSEGCASYEIQINHQKGGLPYVRIRKPIIPEESWGKVHVYPNGNLCLYDPRERPWKWTDNLHETIIPWTAEWLVFYELFLVGGKWLGPEAKHGTASKVEQ